jgi:Ala-tRNA(Pro) deacylase
MNSPVLNQLTDLLDAAGIAYRRVDHAATYTCEDSARARNEPLQVGAKALLLKADAEYAVAVMPADRKLDSGAVKRMLGAKSLRFATTEELLELTGLVPGALPPFGKPILPFPLFADVSTGREFGRVAFNAGSRTTSLILQREDWLTIAQPALSSLCKAE